MESSSVNNTWLSNDSSNRPAGNTASATDTPASHNQHVYGVIYFPRFNLTPSVGPHPGELVGVYNNVTAANKAAAKILKEKIPEWRDLPFRDNSYRPGQPDYNDRVDYFYDLDGAVDYQVHLNMTPGWICHQIAVKKRIVRNGDAVENDDSDLPHMKPVKYVGDGDAGSHFGSEVAEKEPTG